jgi:hypothetical protein
MADLESPRTVHSDGYEHGLPETVGFLALCLLERDDPAGAAGAIELPGDPGRWRAQPSFPSYLFAFGALERHQGFQVATRSTWPTAGTVYEYSIESNGALSPMSAGALATPGSPSAIVAGGVATTLTASRDAPLTLTLTAGVSNTPLAGQMLTFTAGGRSCTTTTNASGQVGACEASIAALTSGFEVTYAGNPDYLPANTQTAPLDEFVPSPLCNVCEPK